VDYRNETTLEDPNITTEEDRAKNYWQKDHVRLYGLDYPQKLEAVGFKSTRIDMAEEVGEELRDRYCLGYGDKVYRVDK